MQTHYSLKNEVLKKVFHSKHGPWRRTCCYCRCVYIRKEEKKKKRKTHSTWVKPWLTRRDALGITLLSLYESGFKSHKHLSFLQMLIKLPVSFCFLFMVAFIPFLYQLYFFILWNRNLGRLKSTFNEGFFFGIFFPLWFCC